MESGGSYPGCWSISVRLVYPCLPGRLYGSLQARACNGTLCGWGTRHLYGVQQIGSDGRYHWISVQIIYVENPFNSDMLAINLVKILDAQRAEQARQEQLLRDALASAKAANRGKIGFPLPG